jgi:rRNA maturation RNase YbeY
VDRSAIAEINREYRGNNTATDILSFAYHAVEIPGLLPSLPDQHFYGELDVFDDGDTSLGDLVVCADVVAANAVTDFARFEDRLPVVLVHGCVHGGLRFQNHPNHT